MGQRSGARVGWCVRPDIGVADTRAGANSHRPLGNRGSASILALLQLWLVYEATPFATNDTPPGQTAGASTRSVPAAKW